MRGWASILFNATIQLSFGQNVEIAFRLAEKDLIPEGITSDPTTKSFMSVVLTNGKLLK